MGEIEIYMVVGQDVVTNWLKEGWELYGSPMWDSNSGWARQAMVKRKPARPKTAFIGKGEHND